MLRTTCFLLILLAAPLRADEPPTAPPALAEADDAIPDDLKDPAFDRYVDLLVLREALTKGNPVALADCALQLAEGERILFRPHKVVGAKKVFRVAIKAAIESRDKETLQRLGRAAQVWKDEELTASVDTALKLASAARKTDPSVTVALDQISPEAVILYRSITEQIKAARAVGSKEQLDSLEKAVKEMDELGAQIKGALVKQIAEVRASLPEGSDADSDVLARLAMSSRKVGHIGGPSGHYSITITNKTRATIDYTLNGTKKSSVVNKPDTLKGSGVAHVAFGTKKYTLTSGNYHFQKTQQKDGSFALDLYRD